MTPQIKKHQMRKSDILTNISNIYGLLEKGKKKHNIGDIVTLGKNKYIVIVDPKNPNKQTYKYYGKGTGTKAKQHISTTSNTQSLPSSPAKLEYIKFLGGTTGATLYRDNHSNKLIVEKKGNSRGQRENEALTLRLYKAFRVPVPELVGEDSEAIYTEYINGRSLEVAMSQGYITPKEAEEQLQKHFVVDALLANWDSTAEGNVIYKDGKLYRVDLGGSMEYRAQGAKKNDWSTLPAELDTMRSSSFPSHKYFGSISHDEIAKQLLEFEKLFNTPEVNDILSQRPDLRNTIEQRLKHGKSLFTSYVSKLETSNETKKESSKLEKLDFFHTLDLYNSGTKSRFSGLTEEHRIEIRRVFSEINDALHITNEDLEFIEKHKSYFGASHLPSSHEISISSLKDFPINPNISSGSCVKFANDNNISEIETYAIRTYTGDDFEAINQSLVNMISGTKNENIDLTDLQHLKKISVNTNSYDHISQFPEAKRAIIAKLAARGILRCFDNYENSSEGTVGNITPYSVTCYRNVGGYQLVDRLKDVFQQDKIIAQCRFMSTSYKSNVGIGGKAVLMRHSSVGLNVHDISYHPGEREILFRPFIPVYVDFSYVNTNEFTGHQKLNIISSDANDHFFLK